MAQKVEREISYFGIAKNKISQFLKVYSFNLEAFENHFVGQDFSWPNSYIIGEGNFETL